MVASWEHRYLLQRISQKKEDALGKLQMLYLQDFISPIAFCGRPHLAEWILLHWSLPNSSFDIAFI